MMEAKKSALDDLKEAIERAQEEFSKIEESILLMGKEKDWDPEVFVPAIMYLYASGSKELGMPFEKALKFAATTLTAIYEVDLVDVEPGEEEDGEEISLATSKHMH